MPVWSRGFRGAPAFMFLPTLGGFPRVEATGEVWTCCSCKKARTVVKYDERPLCLGCAVTEESRLLGHSEKTLDT